MPSHQERREPLPENYQFGDAAPKLPHHVTLSRFAYRMMLRLWGAQQSQFKYGFMLNPDVDFCTIQLADTVFHRGDY